MECFGVFSPKLIMYFVGNHFIVTEYEGITTYNIHLPCLLHSSLTQSATAMEKLPSH